MSRLLLLLFSFFVFAAAVFASPVPLNDTDTDATRLEKRTDHYGRGTYFDVGLGACGKTNKNSDHIVALGPSMYSDDGGHCNQYVHITNTANGKTVYAQVRDKCPSCSSGSLDMSPSAFSAIGKKSTGVLNIKWHFMKKGWKP